MTDAELLGLAFENAPSGVAILRPDGRFERVNRALCEMLGRRPDELTGVRWQDILHRDDRRGGERGEEFRSVRPDGLQVHVRMRSSALPDNRGAVAQFEDITARRAREKRLEAVVDAAAEAVVGVDEHDIVRLFSPSAERLFGWSAREIVGRSVWSLALADREDRIRSLRATLVAGRTVHRETVVQRRDGTPVDVFISAGPILGSDGSYRGATLTALDVSDRRSAERDAGRSRELLQQVIDHAPDVIAFKDRDSRYRLINRLGAGIFGLAPDRIVGRSDAELLPADEAARNQAEDQRVMAARAPMTFSKDVTLPDGTVRPHLATKFPITGETGEIEGVGVVAVDISAIRRGEADRARLGALAEAVPDAIVIQDDNGTITSWNRGAEAMFGLAPGDAIGRSYEDELVPRADRPAFRRVWRDLEYGRTRSLRLGARRADGSVFPAQISAAALTEGRTVIGAVTVIRDISDLLEAQRELERSNADLERFAYAASHDLQEPLRSIEMGAESVMRAAGERLEDDERSLLSHVERSASRMSAQVEALMQLARVALEHAPDEPTLVHDALSEAFDALHAGLEETGAQLRVQEPLPNVGVPRAELALVLQNLIANAIKFRRPGVPPCITVSATADATTVELRVADNGVGLSREAAARIFGLFERDRAGVPGTGVGLAVCRHILERRGGAISVSSAGPGQGAEFALRLPAAASRPA
jgi:PAS domain S-box-containing protein